MTISRMGPAIFSAISSMERSLARPTAPSYALRTFAAMSAVASERKPLKHWDVACPGCIAERESSATRLLDVSIPLPTTTFKFPSDDRPRFPGIPAKFVLIEKPSDKEGVKEVRFSSITRGSLITQIEFCSWEDKPTGHNGVKATLYFDSLNNEHLIDQQGFIGNKRLLQGYVKACQAGYEVIPHDRGGGKIIIYDSHSVKNLLQELVRTHEFPDEPYNMIRETIEKSLQS